MTSRMAHTPLVEFLHVLAMSAVAVAQPLFDLLSAQVGFFAARKSEPIDVILFAVCLSLLLPATLVLLYRLFGLFWQPLGKFGHRLLMTILFGLLSLLVLKRAPILPPSFVVASALVLALALTVAYVRSQYFRQMLSFLAPASVLFLILFLLNANVRKFVFPADQILTPTGQTVRKVPVVIVVFDELPLSALMTHDRRIDGINFPNFKALADDSIWFRNATTVVPVTNFAIPAILAGVYPTTWRDPIYSHYPQNMFTVLAQSHDLYSYESGSRLCPPSSCGEHSNLPPLRSRLEALARDTAVIYLHLLLPPALTGSIPPISNRWYDFFGGAEAEGAAEVKAPSAEQMVAEMRKNRLALFRNLIDRIGAPERSRAAFHFLHLLLPHTPWRYYPSGKLYTEEKIVIVPGLGGEQDHWIDDDWLVTQGYQRFLLQLRMVDMMLGRLLAHLKTIGMYDRTLLIVTADHGAGFRPGDAFRRLTPTNYGEIMPVPLFIKVPGRSEGRIDDRNVELIDVFPTVAALLSVELEQSIDGHALLTEDGESTGAERAEKRMFDIYSHWQNKSDAFPAHPDLVAEAVERKQRIFANPSEESFYRMGELSELLGRAAASIRGGLADGIVSFAEKNLFENVDLEDYFLPGLINGSIRGLGADGAADLWFAIALNGVVAAVTRAYEQSGDLLFSALLPEVAFVPGRNSVDVYLIERFPDGYRLKEFRDFSQSECSLEGGETGRERIVFASGETLPVVPDAVMGYLDYVKALGRTIKFSGWAIEGNRQRIADAVIVTVDGRCAFFGPHSGIYRPDMERHYNLPRGGWGLTISADMLVEDDDLTVRVFGVSQSGRASELQYLDWYKWRMPRNRLANDRENRCSLEVGANGSERIVFSNGETLPIVPGAVRGYLDHVRKLGATVKFSGWAIEGNKKRVAADLIVTVDGRCAFYGRHSRIYRVDIERHYGLPQAGWELTLSADTLVEHDGLMVRLFAASHSGTASELSYLDGYQWRKGSH